MYLNWKDETQKNLFSDWYRTEGNGYRTNRIQFFLNGFIVVDG